MAWLLDPRTGRRLPLTDDLVLSLLEDGNCSDLELDDADEEEFVPPVAENEVTASDKEFGVPELTPSQLGVKRSATSLQDNAEAGPSKKRKKPVKIEIPRRKRIWKKTEFIDTFHEYVGHPEPNIVRSPIEYFSEYYNDDFFEQMSVCTNMYYTRKTGRILNCTKPEIKKLYGIHLMMGILSYPRIAMYWRQKICIEAIVSAMTRDRFMLLRNNLHVVESDTPPAGYRVNPLWKVQPVIDAVKQGCNKILRTPGRFSVDEQMIPFTGKCHLRQLLKNKPRPVGLKNFVVTTNEGLMIDFEIYYRNNPVLSHPLGLGPAVVFRLIQSVPPGSCIFFDRYFTTIPLLDELKRLGYHGTGKIMVNRIPERQQISFKEDKTMRRGDIDQRVSNGIVLVKWKDSKAVLTTSNCTGGTAINNIKRYDKIAKCYIDVDAPKIVTFYNTFMGGVDVLDQSMEYYRTYMKTRKWTLKVILHFMDLAVVNAWRLYRCDSLAKGIPKNRIQDLLAFRFEIAETFMNTPDRDRLQSTPLVELQVNLSSRYRPAKNPSIGMRYDGYDHLPVFDDIKAPRKCRLESCSSRSKIRCHCTNGRKSSGYTKVSLGGRERGWPGRQPPCRPQARLARASPQSTHSYREIRSVPPRYYRRRTPRT
ncbi:piggyBac transposable element-derived protein 3-like [Achroia grisella]|uniref:piggyBac transposable element-derived protein 3-like n=1 Tax=Achroia grisella TaxID=688607 RepID=UPI0027D1FF61|nr:piggyBac transposable element-derived protein 3-like [Achroia grisella]